MEERFLRHRTVNQRRVVIWCALGLTTLILALTVPQANVHAVPGIRPEALPVQVNAPEISPLNPKQKQQQRIKLVAGKSVEVSLGEAIVSAVVADSKIASAENSSDRRILIRGLAAGKTTLVVMGKTRRLSYGIEVQAAKTVKIAKGAAERKVERAETTSGSHSFFFTPGFNGSSPVLRHAFDYTSKPQPGRTLRMSGDYFKVLDGAKVGPTAPGRRFGANRITFGVDTPMNRVDLLDSQLDISQMSLTGYALRGLHLTSTAESRWRGLEIFAGTARPQVPYFKRGEGRLAGAMVPIGHSKTLRLRAGALLITPNRELVSRQGTSPAGSLVVQTDLRYTPNEGTNIEAEIARSTGGMSGRAKVDFRRGPFSIYGELARLDESSPLILIGAQSGGRQASVFNGQWRPNSRFTTAVSYGRNTNLPPTRLKRLQLNSALLLASTSFTPFTSARLGVIFNNYASDAPAPLPLPFFLRLETRSVTLKYDQDITARWINEFEGQIILSREGHTAAQMGRGLSLRQQLRYTSKRGSISGLSSYRSNTPSFESLVIQNPFVLPAQYRAAFGADPTAFMLRNRKALPVLLQGLSRPVTQNWDIGLRVQRTISRLNLLGEASYSKSKFMATSQRSVQGSINGQFAFDASNSLQVTASRFMVFGVRQNQMALSMGYVYRFGAGSGGGFQFSKLFRK